MALGFWAPKPETLDTGLHVARLTINKVSLFVAFRVERPRTSEEDDPKFKGFGALEA